MASAANGLSASTGRRPTSGEGSKALRREATGTAVINPYRLEWRYRSTERDGRVREVTRACVAGDGVALKALGANFSHEAVGREFIIELVGTASRHRVCVRSEELAEWAPVAGCLPRGIMRTHWEDDEQAGVQRYRLLTTISAAFDEARSLRLIGRHDSREILRRVRGALLRT